MNSIQKLIVMYMIMSSIMNIEKKMKREKKKKKKKQVIINVSLVQIFSYK
jgi:glycerol-3-phosphate responsive antiterminator